jgi:uncharacterized protein DUF4082/concanavalin A-like lectin/glucanase superfamily protein/Big-like domain-containing protein/galactose oxidase-like protein/Kelch motif protein
MFKRSYCLVLVALVVFAGCLVTCWPFRTVRAQTNSLVAAYSMNEGTGTRLNDLSGNSNDGTISGATWNTSGRFGDALSFNGSTSWVTINDSNSLDLTNAMTLEAWVRPTATQNNWRAIMLKERPAALYAFDDTSRPPAVYVNTGSGDVAAAGSSQLPLDTWTHLAGTYDGSTVRLYVNAGLVSSRAVSGNILTSSGALRLGGNSIWGEYFQGLIDEVRVYKGVLSQTEIQSDMNTALVNDFTFTASPATRTISPNGSASYDADVAFLDGFTSNNVDLWVTGLPQGVTGIYAPDPLPHQGKSVLDLTSSNAPVGTYTLTMGATAEGITRSQSVTLTVSSSPDFTISVDPSTQNVADGDSTTCNVTLTSINGFTSPVSLSVSGLPTGATGSFAPQSLTPTATSILTTNTSTGTPQGRYTLTITGTSGSLVHSTEATLIVTGSGTAWLVSSIGTTGVGNNCVQVGPARNDAVTRVYVGTIQTGRVLEYSWNGSSWSNPIDIGGSPVGQEIHNMGMGPGRNDGVKRIYACSLDRNVYEISYNGSSWTQSVIGTLNEEAMHAAVGDGRNDGINRVYAVSIGNVYEFTWTGSSWNKVLIGGAPGAHGITVGAARNNSLNSLYIASISTGTYEARYVGNSWALTQMGDSGDVRNVETGIGRNDGVTRLYAALWAGQVREFTWNGSSWTFNEINPPLGASLIHAIPLDGRNDRTNRLYASASNGNTYEFTWNGSSWTTPYNMGGSTDYMYGLHFGTGRNDSVIRVYGADRGTLNKVYEYTWSTPPPSSDTTPPTVTSTSPASGATSVGTGTNVTATFSEAMDPATINTNALELRNPSNTLVAATVTYDAATRTATLNPTPTLAASTTYTATIKGGATDPRVKDVASNALAANFTWSFTTAASPPPPACPCSIWSSSTVPTSQDSDTSAIEVGVKFRSDIDGYITAVRFYKYATNTGTHVGNLWNSSGTRLATATFTGETGSGWQQVSLATPMAITANTTYVASYHTNVGRYAGDLNYFAVSGRDNAPLHALQNGVDGANGVYAYGANSIFPTQTYQSENYWVDVVFTTSVGPDTTPPTVTAVTPASGATGVVTATNVTATFSEAMDAATISTNTFELRNPSNTLVAATVTYDAATRTATMDPTPTLSGSTTYTVTVKGGGTDPRVKDVAGNALAANFTWSFTTGSGGPLPGQWSAPFNLGLVAVNMVLMRTGKVLMYAGQDNGGTSASVWDPTTGTVTPVPNNQTNIFCSGHSALADGRILVVGGYDNANGILGSADANIFDPTTQLWTALPRMAYRRWYPSATTLGDGRVLVTSGATTCFTCIADVPEIYDPVANSWTQLTAARLAFPYYPFSFLLPSGKVLIAGANEQSSQTWTLDVGAQTWTTVDPIVVDGHSAAMYGLGKVIKSGSATDSGSSNVPAASTAYVLDMNQPSPAWRQIASMAFPRAYQNTTLLPDGNVLVTGGERRTDGADTSQAIYEAELWSPLTETWQTMARSQVPRLYHSTALLLPDARVLVAGGGNGSVPNFGQIADQLQGEIYSPPYLFKGARPTITSAPQVVQHGSNFVVQTPDAANIASIALMRPGAVTHAFDEEQRFLNLTFQQGGGSLTVQAPANVNQAPPGFYLLFIVNTNGVPSIAPFVRLSSAPAVTSTSPSSGASGINTGTNVTATFSEAMDASTINTNTFELRDSSNNLVAATVSYDSATKTATLNPTPTLNTSTVYTATIKGGATDPRAKNLAGVALASNVTWSFTTIAAADTTPPTVTAVTPASGATGVVTGTNVTATFSEAMDAATINTNTLELRNPSNTLVAATVTYDAATRTATLDPTPTLAASTTYTATIKGGATDPRMKDVAGNALAANFTWSFTTAASSPPPTCPCSIWSSSTVPTSQDSDTSAIEVGVKFRSDFDGYITALRFYKYATNTGTHVGNLWNSSGTRLATATFTGETASGWQQVSFATPVAITANTTYIASYHTNVGRYAGDINYFAVSGRDNAPLHALQNGVDGADGVYAYGANSIFPTQTYQSENYWVDVVFTTSVGSDTTAPTVTAVTPASGATGVVTGTNVTATFSEAMDAATISTNTFELRNPSNTLVAATVTYDAATKTAILDPTPTLSGSTTYTATIKGGATDPRVKDVAGNALAANFTWSFSTAAVDTTPPTVSSVTPANGASSVGAGTNITATFSEAMDAATISTNTFELRNPSNTLVAATVTYDAATRTATLDPTPTLTALTTYTATIKGGATDPRVKDQAGNALAANFTWSFTTATPGPTCPCSIWSDTTLPSRQDPDTDAIEIGIKFRADTDGYITAVRFYKYASNTGTHVGNLWTSTGTKLATATFTNETASGWQQISFATPVAITANTTYIVSYHTNVGRYAADDYYFATTGVTNGPLQALQDGQDGGNGVYAYGANSIFPTQTYQSENYWVDVVFTTNPGP